MNELLKQLMTDYNFTILFQDKEVAKVTITNHRKNVTIEKLVPDGMYQPFGGHKLDLERVYRFLQDRCYEDCYAGLDEVLSMAEMTENNPWEWNRKSHGRTTADCFWIRFEGEDLTWKDVS
ncbi:MAG: hypothetical protein R3Y24_15185 [Eubacteriales bacterium]